MIEEQQETRSEKETGRLEAFSDGVFAVAITLLIFSLQVPTLDKPYTSQQLVSKLLNLWPSYLAFFISFATILIMWISHHSMFKALSGNKGGEEGQHVVNCEAWMNEKKTSSRDLTGWSTNSMSGHDDCWQPQRR